MLSAFIREQAHCTGCQGKLTVLYNNERGGEKIHFSSGMTLPTSLVLLKYLWINGDKSAGNERKIQKCLKLHL